MRERISPENVISLWVFWCITISPAWAFCTVRPVPKWPDLPSVSAKQEAGPSVLLLFWWCFTADPEPWMQNWQLWMNVCPTITGLPRDMDRVRNCSWMQRQHLCREIFQMHRFCWSRLIPPLHQTDSTIFRSAVTSLLQGFPFFRRVSPLWRTLK